MKEPMDYINFARPGEHSNATNCTIAIDRASKKFLFGIEDERLLRRKYNLYESNTRGYISDLLKKNGLDSDSIEILDTQGLTSKELTEIAGANPDITGAVRGHYVAEQFKNHHLYHALNAYKQSRFNDAAIIVIDGCDYPENGKSIVIYQAKDNKLTEVKSYDTRHSLGLYYALGCIMNGFNWNEGGKLMGLSSYTRETMGYNRDVYPMFILDSDGNITKEFIHFEQREYVNEGPSAKVFISDELKSKFLEYGNANSIEDLIHRPFSIGNAPLATYFQLSFEHTLFQLVEFAENAITSDNLILTGGCALNCVANGEMMRSTLFENVFVPPQCDDSGNALGAAIHRFGIEVKEPMVYNKITYPIPDGYYREIESKDVAHWIRTGKIVAWFEGGSEYGPRALCHRSLLADPERPYISYRLNEIKNRDYWRPLAPVVLDTYFSKIFEAVDPLLDPEWQAPHQYMLATEYLRSAYRLQYPAICAPDGSTRPQVLTRNKHNVTLYNIMDNYNMPVLVNTSMNTRGEPICETPEDAIKFCSGKLDVMLVFVKNGKLYTKE